MSSQVHRSFLAVALCVLLPSVACSTDAMKAAPAQETVKEGARFRTNGQNFKDRQLAFCVGYAYRGQGNAGKDAMGVGDHLFPWTLYSQEPNVADPEASALMEKYLAREYNDPAFSRETGIKVPFDFAKCLDFYHSKALDDIVRKHVVNPDKIAGER